MAYDRTSSVDDRVRTGTLSRPTTITDSVVEALRSEILTGRLGPGEHLHQARLAQRFGISRIPMRDALARLEGDGLVVIDARRGAHVVELSTDDVEEIYDIRLQLEPVATRLAVARMADEDVRRLIYLSEAMDAVAGDPVVGQRSRRTFYEGLYQLSGRSRLVSVIMRLRDEVTRYHVLAVSTSRHAHAGLRRAIRSRDADAAADIIRSHLLQAREDLIHRLSKVAEEGGHA